MKGGVLGDEPTLLRGELSYRSANCFVFLVCDFSVSLQSLHSHPVSPSQTVSSQTAGSCFSCFCVHCVAQRKYPYVYRRIFFNVNLWEKL